MFQPKKIFYTILLILIYAIQHTNSFIAYDCSGTKLNITSFNTLNVDYCSPPLPNKIERIHMIKLLQKTESKQIQFQACYIVADYIITKCAGFDDAQIVGHGYFTELIQTGAVMCADAHVKRSYTFYPGITAHNLKINQTMYFSELIKGTANHEGDCYGETFRTDKYEWNNVLVQAKYKIQLSEGTATANSIDNVLILPTGTRLKLSDTYGIDSHKGEIVWQNNHKTDCTTDKYDTLYEGPATLITSKQSMNSTSEIQTFLVESDNIAFALRKINIDYACNIQVFQTEHPRLIILTDPAYMHYFHTKPISTFNTDLMAYINTKFVYIQNIIQASSTSMYLDLVTKQCNLERKILMQKLSLASYSLSEFAYAMGEGPGFTALKSGEIVYLLKCKPVDVELDRSHKVCFQELPVIYNKQKLFMAPKTHTLQKYGTEIDCTIILPTGYLMEGEWISMSPEYNELGLGKIPQILKPQTAWTWSFRSPENLMNAGLYSSDMINALQKHLLFPQEVDAAQSNLARQTMGYNTFDQGLKLKPFIDEQIISRLVEEKLYKMWGWFVGFGNFISGLLGLFVAWKIIMICLNTTINMSILYQTFGCSFKVLAGIFASMTQYFMHKSHTRDINQNSNNQDEQSTNDNNNHTLNTVQEQHISPPQQIYPSFRFETNTSHYQVPRRSM
ncbi:unnamed protein product [Macrosiphum euphorbiae]|uniref:Glycoprotein n=1 Tax=Macrosiphum euphorbiae TaxID=13131 RepID=A0AAV0YAU3_9HEMI|nr:unnamed protein product [Macrosiphum euphorbiae]